MGNHVRLNYVCHRMYFCSSPLPILGVMPISRHPAVPYRPTATFISFPLAPFCWPFPSTRVLHLSFLCLSSYNPPILAVVLLLVFSNIPVSLTQIIIFLANLLSFCLTICPVHLLASCISLPVWYLTLISVFQPISFWSSRVLSLVDVWFQPTIATCWLACG